MPPSTSIPSATQSKKQYDSVYRQTGHPRKACASQLPSANDWGSTSGHSDSQLLLPTLSSSVGGSVLVGTNVDGEKAFSSSITSFIGDPHSKLLFSSSRMEAKNILHVLDPQPSQFPNDPPMHTTFEQSSSFRSPSFAQESLQYSILHGLPQDETSMIEWDSVSTDNTIAIIVHDGNVNRAFLELFKKLGGIVSGVGIIVDG
mmetsp:Transcript_39768/g.46496  ORF Transcript_39768/g.46496 Transcript_39768/m.46496 type:complete len:202 (+) Transcript_39768:1266-1871(+)